MQTNNGLDKSKQTKQNTHVYLIFGGMGYRTLAGRNTSLSLGNGGAMAQWENEWMREGCAWIERQRVSRHPQAA